MKFSPLFKVAKTSWEKFGVANTTHCMKFSPLRTRGGEYYSVYEVFATSEVANTSATQKNETKKAFVTFCLFFVEHLKLISKKGMRSVFAKKKVENII